MSGSFSNDHTFDRQTQSRIHFSLPQGAKVLDTVQLAEMERSFRTWAEDSPRQDVRRSRQRILYIFLLIRHTGAKLHEVLDLKSADISLQERIIRIGGDSPGGPRTIDIPDDLVSELDAFIKPDSFKTGESLFRIDPAHVRRKFYERAEACGLPSDFGNPSTLRRSRAVELLRGNLPLPVVRKLLGYSTSGLAATLLEVSEEDMHHIVRRHIDLESKRRTSARNTFFGKITRIIRGDIQSEVVLTTLGGLNISSVITNNSVKRMRLKTGTFVTAEIKAPTVFISGPEGAAQISAENRVQGTVAEISSGQVNDEVLLRLEDGTEMCAVITSASRQRLGLRVGDKAWSVFGAYSVILNIE